MTYHLNEKILREEGVPVDAKVELHGTAKILGTANVDGRHPEHLHEWGKSLCSRVVRRHDETDNWWVVGCLPLARLIGRHEKVLLVAQLSLNVPNAWMRWGLSMRMVPADEDSAPFAHSCLYAWNGFGTFGAYFFRRAVLLLQFLVHERIGARDDHMLRPRVPGASEEAAHLRGHQMGVEVNEHENVGHDGDEERLETTGDSKGHCLHFEVFSKETVTTGEVNGGKVDHLIRVVDVLAV